MRMLLLALPLVFAFLRALTNCNLCERLQYPRVSLGKGPYAVRSIPTPFNAMTAHDGAPLSPKYLEKNVRTKTGY